MNNKQFTDTQYISKQKNNEQNRFFFLKKGTDAFSFTQTPDIRENTLPLLVCRQQGEGDMGIQNRLAVYISKAKERLSCVRAQNPAIPVYRTANAQENIPLLMAATTSTDPLQSQAPLLQHQASSPDQDNMLTVAKKTPPVVQPGVKHLTPNSPLLFDALSEGNFSLAEALIEENRGLLFVSQVHSANTVLHAAVLHDAPTHMIQMLVEKGADVNRGNDIGRTPVYIAARHDARRETMRYLISVGGEINKKDMYQYTPLMAASYNGASLSLVGQLLALGADMDILDSQERLARDWAIEGNHREIAVFLDNISIIPVLCLVYIPRLGTNSPLKLLPKDLMMLVRDALCLPSKFGSTRSIKKTVSSE